MLVGLSTNFLTSQTTATFLKVLWKSTVLATSPVWGLVAPVALLVVLGNAMETGSLNSMLELVIFVIFAFSLAIVTVLVGLVIYAMPITWLFRRVEIVGKAHYRWVGAFGGALLMMAWYVLAFGHTWPGSVVIGAVMLSYGGFMGGLTAQLWWRSLIMPTLAIRGYNN
jgi:hypothetical protein